jgi:chromosome partitioning protein
MLELNFPVTALAKILGKTHQAIHKFCNENDIEIITGKNKSFLSPQALRQYFEKFRYNYPKEIIAFQACKGGVGKTSLCFNIAARASQYGTKILAIDMDMQAHLTMAVLGNNDINLPVWYDVLKGKPIASIIQKIHPHLHLIPSNLDNSYLDKIISQSSKVVYTAYVYDHLSKIKNNYDLILIDCAPALSHINTAVSIAADKVFIPVNPDLFSFDGLEKTLSELKDIQNSFHKELDVSIILNRFDGREKNSLDVIANLKNKYGALLCSTVVVVSSEIKNSISRKELLFNIKKRPQVADDIDTIVRDLLRISEIHNA